MHKLLVFLFIGNFYFVNAQDGSNGHYLSNAIHLDDYLINEGSKNKDNLIKVHSQILNLPGLSIQYERKLIRRVAVGLQFNYENDQRSSMLKLLSHQLDDHNFAKSQLQNIRYNQVAFTPEIKIYFGKEVFRGFYLAPFIRYAHYDVKLPLQLEYESLTSIKEQVHFKGQFNTVTAGVSVGAQWRIYKNFYLDWLIVGPHFGDAKNHLSVRTSLSENEQQALIRSLDLVKQGIDSVEDLPTVNFDYQVNEKGADIRFKNPWIGLRMQLGIGYRF